MRFIRSSGRLRMTVRANHEQRIYAGSVVRGMVNPLEAVNNLVYLLSVSTEDPTTSARYIKMLQDQLALGVPDLLCR